MIKKQTTLILILLAFFNTILFSQVTTTILYDGTSGLSTSKCNVFDPPISVGGVLHTSALGAATFTVANGLSLPAKFTAPNTYDKSVIKISYPFKANYAYSITILASGDVSAGNSYPTIGAGLFTTSGLTYTSTSCSPGNVSGFPTIGAYFTISVNNNFVTYSPAGASFIPAYNYDYLALDISVAAATSVTSHVNIKKITITETVPISFTLPTPVSIPCGSVTPKTFTVTNVYNTPNVLSYTWNLGANNGWLYNGVAAPSTFTTDANTPGITLTPVGCGTAPKNVSVIVNAGSVNYNTNVSVVNVTAAGPTTLAITGVKTFCTSATYTIPNLPCGATVAWQAITPSGIVSSAVNGNSITLNKTNSGTITLSANVTTTCGVIPLTKNIAVGMPSMVNALKLNAYNATPPAYCTNTFYSFNLISNSSTFSLADYGITDIRWKVVAFAGSAAQFTYNSGSYYTPGSTYINNAAVQIKFPTLLPPINNNTITGSIVVNVENACGWSGGDEFDGIFTQPVNGNVTVKNCTGSFAIIASPNPTTESLRISISSPGLRATNATKVASIETLYIHKIRVMDNKGTLRKSYDFGTKGSSQASINLSGYTPGIYTISVYDGKSWASQTVVKQ